MHSLRTIGNEFIDKLSERPMSHSNAPLYNLEHFSLLRYPILCADSHHCVRIAQMSYTPIWETREPVTYVGLNTHLIEMYAMFSHVH